MGEAWRKRRKVPHPESVVMVLAAALPVAAGCSANGVVGSGGGSHVPQPPAGDFTAFLVHDGSEAVYSQLINEVHDVGGKWLTVEAQFSGTLVVGVRKDAPEAVRSQIQKDLGQSPVVDHVVTGGCDKQPAVCESWRSNLTP